MWDRFVSGVKSNPWLFVGLVAVVVFFIWLSQRGSSSGASGGTYVVGPDAATIQATTQATMAQLAASAENMKTQAALQLGMAQNETAQLNINKASEAAMFAATTNANLTRDLAFNATDQKVGIAMIYSDLIKFLNRDGAILVNPETPAIAAPAAWDTQNWGFGEASGGDGNGAGGPAW